MYQIDIVDDAHVEPLAEATLDVLERVGVLCQNEDMLRAMDDGGAEVDYSEQRARFPRQMVTEFVEDLRSQKPIGLGLDLYGDSTSAGAHDTEAGDAQALQHPEFVAPAAPSLGTQVAQMFYDYERGERRSGNRDDVITMIKLADMLHPDVPAGHSLVQAEMPAMMEALETALLLAEYAHNPGEAFAWYIEQVDYLREMGDILGIEDWFTWGAICFAHPLRFDKAVADKFVRRVQEGVPTGLTGMPIAGFTTPVTVEGFIAVASAEYVATWLAARLINPDVPLSGSMWGGSVDMRTGSVSYCSYDAMYCSFAGVEFIRKWTGINMPVGGGEYTDAKEPGLYTALEKAYKAMMIAAFTGQHPSIGQGMLEEGRTISPVQILLERDYAGGLAQLDREIDPTPERIAMDAIEEVDLGLHANHLQSMHTAQNFRDHLWLPDFYDRAGWAGMVSETEACDRAQAQVNEMLFNYEKPEGREDRLEQMRKVVDRARADLLG